METGLTEAGRALVRRLEAAGSPVVGKDACDFARLLECGDLSGEERTALCERLGYWSGGGYPLLKTRENPIPSTLYETVGQSIPHNSADSTQGLSTLPRRRGRPSKSEMRQRAKAEKERQKALAHAAGPKPLGRPRKVVDWKRLPHNKWLTVGEAAALLSVAERLLRRRIAGEALPREIDVADGRRGYCLRRA